MWVQQDAASLILQEKFDKSCYLVFKKGGSGEKVQSSGRLAVQICNHLTILYEE